MKTPFIEASRRGLFFAMVMFAPILTSAAEVSPTAAASPRLRFSTQPTESEIYSARVFDEPLVPMNGAPTAAENRALAEALEAYSVRASLDDCASLEAFLNANPTSAWKGSLLLHLGTEYYHYGYYSRAVSAWEQSWEEGKKITDGPAKPQADRALGELARIYSKLGRLGQLEALLDSVGDRNLEGPATQLVHAAQDARSVMTKKPDYAFSCGPSALDRILLHIDPKRAGNPLLLEYTSSTNGFCLSRVAELSHRLGMDYQMAFRPVGAEVVVPAVVHWKAGHYAALVEKKGHLILAQDYTFHSSLWMTEEAVNDEASGYFLVPPGALPAKWRAVSAGEGQGVWGKGFVGGPDPNATSIWDYICGPCIANALTGGLSGLAGQAIGAIQSRISGMAVYSVHALLASLTLDDTPVGYTPPVGPPVFFHATYNQSEANQPAVFSYFNLGPKWDCNWLSYINDSPNNLNTSVTLYSAGGGTLTFPFNGATQAYQQEVMSHGNLTRTSSSSYVISYPNGSQNVFAQADGSTGSSRRVFLTQIIDPSGNTVRLQYDSQLRLTSIIDAIGQATTLAYTNAVYPLAITSVTDPFGRSAYIQYNNSGLLSQLTDVIGLTSQFTYATNQFVTAMTTPYGTTTFTTGTTNSGSATYLIATDPTGASEMVEYDVSSPVGPHAYPDSMVPHGISVFNLFLDGRNSFYWDKKAFAEGAFDYTKATIYHWLHYTPNNQECTGILESTKKSLENRVWYNYPGEPTNMGSPYYLDAAYSGASASPTAIARILDDGSEQNYYYGYNAMGNVTNVIDPMGRSFSYTYASNNIDLLQARMTHNGKSQLLNSIAYNAQHLPTVETDAAGQSTTRTFNGRGQLTSGSDPQGNTYTFQYDPNGYLLSLTGPMGATLDTISFTYDSFGRAKTVTDVDGYALTFAYDNMDRVTQITFPDGTTEEHVFNRLDPVALKDRLGRWTTNAFDAARRPISVLDPLGRLTQYEWCKCGAMTALIDPLGRMTSWAYDIQGRPITKQFPDGTTESYTYENTTSRLLNRTSADGQITLRRYYVDNSLKSVSYPNATTPTPTVTYTYDPDFNRISTMQDGIGTTVYSYNPITSPPALGASQLASVSGPLPNSLVTYQYDAQERIASRVIDGVAENNGYDSLGRVVGVTNGLGAFKYSWVDATRRLASLVYPNGQSNVYSYYNNAGDRRLMQILNYKPGGALLSGAGYVYNAVGEITSWTNQWDVLPSRVWSASYDAANQLAGVAGTDGVNYGYAYDLAGNRTSAVSNGVATAFSYNSLNQLTASGLSPSNNVTYEWDAAHRLTAINNGPHRSEFSYNGQDLRARIVEKLNGAVVSDNYFLWCDQQMCEQRDSSGANILRRYYSQGEVVIGATGATNLYYTRDHLGSVREALDSTGALQARYDYDPWGQQKTLSGNMQVSFGFTSAYQHRPTGLGFALYRGFDPKTGRWLNRDPLGEAGGVNLYAYGDNDPLNQTDVSGEIVPVVIAIGAILGAVAFAGYAAYQAYYGDHPPVTTASGAFAFTLLGAGVGAVVAPAAAWLAEAAGGVAAGAMTTLAGWLGVSVPAGSGAVATGGIIVTSVIERGEGFIRGIYPCH